MVPVLVDIRWGNVWNIIKMSGQCWFWLNCCNYIYTKWLLECFWGGTILYNICLLLQELIRKYPYLVPDVHTVLCMWCWAIMRLWGDLNKTEKDTRKTLIQQYFLILMEYQSCWWMWLPDVCCRRYMFLSNNPLLT